MSQLYLQLCVIFVKQAVRGNGISVTYTMQVELKERNLEADLFDREANILQKAPATN